MKSKLINLLRWVSVENMNVCVYVFKKCQFESITCLARKLTLYGVVILHQWQNIFDKSLTLKITTSQWINWNKNGLKRSPGCSIPHLFRVSWQIISFFISYFNSVCFKLLLKRLQNKRLLNNIARIYSVPRN